MQSFFILKRRQSLMHVASIQSACYASGSLLIAAAPQRATDLLVALRSEGHAAARIGNLPAPGSGYWILRRRTSAIADVCPGRSFPVPARIRVSPYNPVVNGHAMTVSGVSISEDRTRMAGIVVASANGNVGIEASIEVLRSGGSAVDADRRRHRLCRGQSR